MGAEPDGPENLESERTAETAQYYIRLRVSISEMRNEFPSQELGGVAKPLDDFLDQPATWQEVKYKAVLWMCGNTLRNILSQHEAVAADSDPHYAKQPKAVAEALRHLVTAWNVFVFTDPALRDFDAQSIGPQEDQSIRSQLDTARPILHAAAADRHITTAEAGETIERTIAAAGVSAPNIHTEQAHAIVRNTWMNLITELLRVAYRTASDLQDPKSPEAKKFAEEAKSVVYKGVGGLALAGATYVTASLATTVYGNGLFFVDFVVTQSSLLKAFLVDAFQNPQLAHIVDSIAAIRAKLVSSRLNENDAAVTPEVSSQATYRTDSKSYVLGA